MIRKISLTCELYALAASRGPLHQGVQHGLLGRGPVTRYRHRLRRHVCLHGGHACQGDGTDEVEAETIRTQMVCYLFPDTCYAYLGILQDWMPI